MMEQGRGQLSRIMSCGRGCAQGGGGSSASSWKSSHLCQQGAASSAQVFWSILEKGHCDVIYRQFCAVRSPLWSRHMSGNVFLQSKCRVLKTVPTKPLFHRFSTTCVRRGSKAVTRSGPVSQDWPVSVVGSLHRDTSGCWGTAAHKKLPNTPRSLLCFPHHIHCKIRALLLPRETSRSQIWLCLGCKSPHLSCVWREGCGG